MPASPVMALISSIGSTSERSPAASTVGGGGGGGGAGGDVVFAVVVVVTAVVVGRFSERLRSDGHEVRALSRSDAAAEKIRLRGGEPVPGHLGDVEAMKSGASGCDWAFHAAATVADWGTPEEFERGNVTGTRNALEACTQAGVRLNTSTQRMD